jgi:hypothetical protein
VALALTIPAGVATDSSVTVTSRWLGTSAELRDGDLVFRRGHDAIGRIVLSHGDQPRFSHVAMVVRGGDRTLVVHALPITPGEAGGVRVEPLERFSSPLRAADVGYYRPQGLTDGQRASLRRYLFDHVGTPFDLRFAYSSDDAMYCTELVLKALASVGVDLTPTIGTVRVVMLDEPAFAPDALWRSSRFEVIETTEQVTPVAGLPEEVKYAL